MATSLLVAGETPETIEETFKFAQELDCETIQVSLAHAYPGTDFTTLSSNGYLRSDIEMTDETGHQLTLSIRLVKC